MSGGQLVIGWPGPSGTQIRLARPGDEGQVEQFIRMAGVEDDRPAIDGIRDGSIATTVITAADRGRSALEDWVNAAVAAADNPTHLWPAMTLVLVALDDAGTPVGALLAHPPMNVINHGINAGIDERVMFGTAAVLARVRALAVDPAWRSRGIGAALMGLFLTIYGALGFLILYGQIEIAERLEGYYPRFGFEVLEPGYGFSLSGLVGAAYDIGPVPGQRLILQSRVPLVISQLAPPGWD